MRKLKRKQQQKSHKRIEELNNQINCFLTMEQNQDIIFNPSFYNEFERIMGIDISEISEPIIFFDKKCELEREMMCLMMEEMDKEQIIRVLIDVMNNFEPNPNYTLDNSIETDIEVMKRMDLKDIKNLLRIKQKLEMDQRRSRIFKTNLEEEV